MEAGSARPRVQSAAGGGAAGADAVGDADAFVGVAGEVEAGEGGEVGLDFCEAGGVADRVLSHGAAPAVDAGESGRGVPA